MIVRTSAARIRPGSLLLFALLLTMPACAMAQAPTAAPTASSAPDSVFWAGLRWRSIGPANMGGRITDIEGLPSPSKTFYVAAAAGGIWKTTNNGITFRPVFDDQRVISMGDIAIAPSDTSIIWAGSGEEDSRNSISPGGGIYKSTDGGMSWEMMGLEGTQSIGRILIHPTDPNTVWVAALGHPWGSNPERGLYKTTDGGETWKLAKFISDKAGFVDLVMHPRDPNTLWASSWERVRNAYEFRSGGPGSALWKSTDGGESWTEVTGGGFPATNKGRIGIDIARSNPEVMYALVEAEKGDSAVAADTTETALTSGQKGSGLYRSADGGRTWRFMNDENTRPFYYSQVRVDPSDEDHVIWSSTPVRLSRDGGKTVGSTTIGIHVDHHALWWDAADPDRFIVGNDGGVAMTWDKGGNYQFINTMPLGQFYEIGYDMSVPYNVCGGLQDNGTWCGPSRRADGDITNKHWATVNGGDGFFAVLDPRDNHLLYAESQRGNVARINLATGDRTGLDKPDWRDGTKAMRDSIALMLDEDDNLHDPSQAQRLAALRERVSADSAALDLRYNWNTPIELSPHNPDVLYIGANCVLRSMKRGEDLEPISPDLTYNDTTKYRISTETTGGITRDATGAETYGTIVALAESPRVPGMLFAGTDDGRVWIRRSEAMEWEELTGRFRGVPKNTYVRRIEPSSHDPQRFYVAFDGHRTDDFTPYLFVTDDGGRSFRSIAAGLPAGKPDCLHVVREDPHNPDLLFAGTDVGVYVSLDRGKSWRRFMNGLPTVPVHDLKIHPRDHELIAGTHGRSIWVVNIAPLEQLPDLQLAAEPVLFASAPALQYGNRAVGGESPGHQVFQADSPEYGAELIYWVPPSAVPAGAGEDSIAPGDQVTLDAPVIDEPPTGVMAEVNQAQDRAGRAGETTEQQTDSVPSPGARAGRRGTQPQAKIVVLNAAGDTVQTLDGPARGGLNRAYWDLRPRAEPDTLSPSERRDSIRTARTVRLVADSMIAAGSDSAVVNRVVRLIDAGETRSLFRGGGGPRVAAGGFAERPGERYTERTEQAAGAERAAPGDPSAEAEEADPMDVARDIFRAVRDRKVSIGFGGGDDDRTPVDPGEYTVHVTVGDRTVQGKINVLRAPGYTVESGSGGEEEWWESEESR